MRSLGLVILVLCICAVCMGFRDDDDRECTMDRWHRVETFGKGPTFTGAATMVRFNNNFYYQGGYLEDFALGVDIYYSSLYEYNTFTRTWTLLDNASGPFPSAYHGAAASTLDSKMYHYGGVTYNQTGQNFYNVTVYGDFFAWSFITNSWSRVTPVNSGPGLRGDFGMAYLDGKIYIFGGISNAYFTDRNDLWVYDIAHNSWTNLIADGAPGSPPARHSLQFRANELDHKIYLYGAEVTALAFAHLNDTWVYDPATNQWTDITPPINNISPPENNYQGTDMVENDLISYGGEVDAPGYGIPSLPCGAPFALEGQQAPTNFTWVFDTRPHHRQWIQRHPNPNRLPPALKRHVASHTIRNGKRCFYVFGGNDFPACPPGQVWNNDLWVLQV